MHDQFMHSTVQKGREVRRTAVAGILKESHKGWLILWAYGASYVCSHQTELTKAGLCSLLGPK